MAVNVPGLVAVIVFYILIVVTGIIGGRKSVRSSNAEEIFVANRSIGPWLSFFTLTATNIGGGYINGTAEAIAFSGLIWTNAPILYCISFAIGAVVYAPKLRRGCYVTMFDPIQMKLGNRAGSLLFFPQLMGDIFWTAAILSALGSTVAIILDMDPALSIIVSACVAVFYTFLGGLYSVAYTDVIQLICLSVGLASDRELIWVMRISTVVVGALACVLAILVKTVYGLYYMSTDLIYVILFPQLTCVLWLKGANTYGSVIGCFVSLFLRVAGGDPLLGMAPLIWYPFYSAEEGQRFPFKSLAMLINFILLIGVFMLTNMMFRREWLPLKFDIFNVIKREDDRRLAEERREGLTMKEREPPAHNTDRMYGENENTKL